jgi:hypothetical protein
MAGKVRLGARVRYWFDNTMSREPPPLPAIDRVIVLANA